MIKLGLVALAASALAGQVLAAACPPADPASVIAPVREMYAAATVDDAPGAKAVLAPGFYAFDGGRRLDADALLAGVKAAHAAGTMMAWNVTEPEVHVTCDQAWATWLNKGSVRDASGAHPVTWLESAMLAYGGGRWRIRFFSSMRAIAPAS